jgi:pimeloyl-ACP methyl ester carboxylesterase
MTAATLNLVDRGEGHPAIVFIHGFTCSLSDWKEQLPSLSASYRCLAVDLPGHGASPAPAEISIEALAKAVNDTLDALQLKDVVLVGHSMGCRLASEAFSQQPGRVRGIVYVDGSILAPCNPDLAVKQTMEKIARLGMDRILGQLYEDFFVGSTPAAVCDFVNARLPAIRMDFASRLWPEIVRWDAARSRAVLASLTVPALAIQSTFLDANFKRASLPPGQTTPWLDALSELVKDLTLTVVPEIGYFPMLETPRQTNDAILSFVRRLDPAPV